MSDTSSIDEESAVQRQRSQRRSRGGQQQQAPENDVMEDGGEESDAEVNGVLRRGEGDVDEQESNVEEDLDAEMDEDDDDDDDEDDEGESCYDPNQPINQRRDIQRGLRELNRDLLENAEEYLSGGSGAKSLRTALAASNEINRQIKQTTEAAIDSRLLVTMADLSYRKAVRETQDQVGDGLDADDFITKCIAFMRQGDDLAGEGESSIDVNGSSQSPPQRSRNGRTRNRSTDEEEDDDENENGRSGDDMLNWSHLGRLAVCASTRRPGLLGFLMGPLSVEKKSRKVAKRTARLQVNSIQEVRPEVIDPTQIEREDNDLTMMCADIYAILCQVHAEIQATVESQITDDMSSAEQLVLMDRYGLRTTGGIDFVRFILDPFSFSRTVENMFYLSFLIRDCKVCVERDDYGVLSIAPCNPEETKATGSRKAMVLNMTYDVWLRAVQQIGPVCPMIVRPGDVEQWSKKLKKTHRVYRRLLKEAQTHAQST